MPLYDCVLLLKPQLRKDSLIELAARIGKHVSRRNGVVTEIKSFGEVQLGYGIKKIDQRYFQGQLMQMTMMATPNINKELHYLNKEDKLLRWILVKHRDIKFGLESFEDDWKDGTDWSPSTSISNEVSSEDDKKDEEDDSSDEEEEKEEGGEETPSPTP